MKKSEKELIENQAEMMKGKRRNSYISKKEIEKMESLDRKTTLKGKTIRVYSLDGFVPNSYKYFAPIDFIERSYEPETGKKIAKKRHDFMVRFLAQFYEECEGLD
jgi:hypothetical protein